MTELSSTTIITGGAGFIGSHLAELLLPALIKNNEKLVLIDDLSTGSRSNVSSILGAHCKLLESKVSNAVAKQPQLFSEAKHIYHLAASVGVELVASDPAAVIRNNIEETSALFKCLEQSEARVLLASTSEVYGKSADVPLRETSDLHYGPTTGPRWSYALSKAVDEQLALSQTHCNDGRPQAVVVRLFNTIGPRQVGTYGMVVPRFIQAALRGEPLVIHGDGEQTRAFCDVRDVVAALASLMETDQHCGQLFNVGSSEELSINQLAMRVLSLVDSASRPKHITTQQAYGQGFEDPFRRRVPDVSKLKKAVGFSRRYELDQTLQELIDLHRA
jgi:UDP-glucose 4-epimerase